MISNEQHDVVRSVAGRWQSKRSELAEFDGERMAVVLRKGREKIVVCGTAAYVRDDTVGNSLRIQLNDGEPGEAVVILAEDQWNGRIIPDFHHGCRYCVLIG